MSRITFDSDDSSNTSINLGVSLLNTLCFTSTLCFVWSGVVIYHFLVLRRTIFRLSDSTRETSTFVTKHKHSFSSFMIFLCKCSLSATLYRERIKLISRDSLLEISIFCIRRGYLLRRNIVKTFRFTQIHRDFTENFTCLLRHDLPVLLVFAGTNRCCYFRVCPYAA